MGVFVYLYLINSYAHAHVLCLARVHHYQPTIKTLNPTITYSTTPLIMIILQYRISARKNTIFIRSIFSGLSIIIIIVFRKYLNGRTLKEIINNPLVLDKYTQTHSLREQGQCSVQWYWKNHICKLFSEIDCWSESRIGITNFLRVDTVWIN